MHADPPEMLELTDEERQLLRSIDFAEPSNTSCEAARKLCLALVRRNAVPKVRQNWVSEARYNVGGRGKSVLEVFVSNGTDGEEIFAHGDFLKYLRYWIFGPDLPPSFVDGFCACVNDDRGTSGNMRKGLMSYVRQATRVHALRAEDVREEVYKLSLECGLGDDLSRVVRDALGT